MMPFREQPIPLFVMTGMLEGGKTTMIKELLSDEEFTEGNKILLVVCEQGEAEYSEELLRRTNTVMAVVEEPEDLTYGFLAKLNKREKPEMVIIEYNGTWTMDQLFTMELPARWALSQILTAVDAQTYELYFNNMRQMMVNNVSYSDLIVFNRCTEDMPLDTYWRNMKMINRQAMLSFERADGEMIEVKGDMEAILPFDINQSVIEIPDEAFGMWYMHALEHPERYEGKIVKFVGMVYRERSFPSGYFVPARGVMTCCAEDVQLAGFLCKSSKADKLKAKSWVRVTAKVQCEYMEAYKGTAPVLYAQNIEACEQPEEEYVQLF
ncbi:MAG: TIGR03943 family protein [Firmicutes bacterium]|nr:TIGR03943 family protein [Bacillota bacterium]